ncbi:LytS/YhcK type 5TM receptor domain-containing protein [Desulfosporosinus hippei]|uniref:Diguanylate cyclase n=1 Tax=Desulfosporosinus hippei DSM 8344 TaxID=1121419 RepID=A0A1G7WA88_9FIRM|nr:LytS/YhcK type 5TM receptor domain-containing protein [Desulfosporosinus hippei]SDG68831.1 diguanylate cyclase [Desulfosporosinus hippei DSM 8344]
MFYDLFSNIVIVVAYLFVIGQIFNKYTLDGNLQLRIRIWIGICFGVLGITLMIYSINVTSTIIVDLRNTAIISSAVIGGPVTVMITSVMIAVYRVLHFGVNSASVMAVVIALVMGLGCAFFSCLRTSRLKKFSYMLVYALAISIAAFSYLIKDFYILLELFSYYIAISIFGVILAYFAVEYIISRQVIERN